MSGSGSPAILHARVPDFYASVEKVRGIAEETDATLVFGHDPEQIATLRTAPDGVYR